MIFLGIVKQGRVKAENNNYNIFSHRKIFVMHIFDLFFFEAAISTQNKTTKIKNTETSTKNRCVSIALNILF